MSINFLQNVESYTQKIYGYQNKEINFAYEKNFKVLQVFLFLLVVTFFKANGKIRKEGPLQFIFLHPVISETGQKAKGHFT